MEVRERRYATAVKYVKKNMLRGGGGAAGLAWKRHNTCSSNIVFVVRCRSFVVVRAEAGKIVALCCSGSGV